MARPYMHEMDELGATLAWVRHANLVELQANVRKTLALPIVSVGSGGSLSAAHHVARLHRTHAGQMALATTPSDAYAFPIPAAHYWLFSAGGSNVDILSIARRLREIECRSLSTMTTRDKTKLVAETGLASDSDVHIVNPGAKKDGFLATNSLLAFCTSLSKAYMLATGRAEEWEAVERGLAVDLDSYQSSRNRGSFSTEVFRDRDHIVVLHDEWTSLGAFDLESKLIEAGLKNVQLADYRHFAHGRHQWIKSNLSSTGVVALYSEAHRHLPAATLALLPHEVPVLPIPHHGPQELMQLSSLMTAYFLTASFGDQADIDPGSPGVPDYGRKIYNIKLKGSEAPDSRSMAVVRKLRAAGAHSHADALTYDDASHLVVQRIENTNISGVVFDYDGTLVDIRRRFTTLSADITTELRRLLSAGVRVGIATGRGRSAGDALRSALPRELWGDTLVGYYNGAELRQLADDSPLYGTNTVIDDDLASMAEFLQQAASPHAHLQIDTRPAQLTVQSPIWTETRTWEWVSGIRDAHGITTINISHSSHSVDVTSQRVSKNNVTEALHRHDGSEVLRVGDRGRWPGNDWHLLNSFMGISVDEVSPDPYTCWNFAPPGARSTDATVHLLRNLRVDGEQLRLRLTRR